eukprot:1393384-Amorphochlora_amoeboformis.AAC.2
MGLVKKAKLRYIAAKKAYRSNKSDKKAKSEWKKAKRAYEEAKINRENAKKGGRVRNVKIQSDTNSKQGKKTKSLKRGLGMLAFDAYAYSKTYSISASSLLMSLLLPPTALCLVSLIPQLVREQRTLGIQAGLSSIGRGTPTETHGKLNSLVL